MAHCLHSGDTAAILTTNPHMKRTLLLLLSLFFLLPLTAQSRREALLEYQSRRRQAYAEFTENYRKAYSDYLRKRWEAFNSFAPVPVPERKEPDAPVHKRPDAPAKPTQDQIPYDEVVEIPAPVEPAPVPEPAPTSKPVQDPKPTPKTIPEPGPAPDASRTHRFTFYGTGCSVSLGPTHRFRLASFQENSVANAWDKVAGGSYDKAVGECLELKKQLALNDWGYYDLVRTVAEGFCGKRSGESVVLRAFLMAEAGYKVRLARADNALYLLLAMSEQVYSRPFFNIDNQTFYILDETPPGDSYYICNFSISGERPASFVMAEPPVFTSRTGDESIHKTDDGKLTTRVAINRNLMDFYAAYPSCYWDVYAATALSATTCRQLYPDLRASLSGKSEQDAVNQLLHYLHQGFDYKTDDAQFGEERTLFAEEMFHYAYSDCEDRSILFARLVRDLLGLDVVLLYYPNHIAAAVRFKDEVAGDYILLDKMHYTICDPTYIGSDVGDAMPDMKNLSARVVKIFNR